MNLVDGIHVSLRPRTGQGVLVQLADWVRREGQVISEEFLRVDGFLNHRIAPAFVEAAAIQVCARFVDERVTLVLTAEAAGNVIAYEISRRLGARAIYAKKGKATTTAHPIVRDLRSRGISILITDHQVRETLQITDRSYVISKGQVLCHGTPQEVVNHAEARAKYFGDGIDLGTDGPPPPHGPWSESPPAAAPRRPRRRETDLD
jgi:hypothetical protein